MVDIRGATPRPWRVEKGTTVIWSDNAYDPGTNCVGCIVARIAQPSSWKGSRPTVDEQEANAALVVKAVNHFDEAVDLLRKVVDEFGCSITQYHRNGPDFTHKDGTEVFEVSVLLNRSEIIDAARALISKLDAA